MEEILKKRFDNFFKRIKKKNKVRKFVFAGSGAVGKTSLVKVLKEKKAIFQFEEEDRAYFRTAFMEIESLSVSDLTDDPDVQGNIVLCDIAGQTDLPIHAFKELSDFVLGGVDLVILVFANGNTQSFLDLEDWMTRIKDYYYARNQPLPAFSLLKNKSDLPGSVDPNFLQMLIENEENIINYIEISCLNGSNIDVFKEFIVKIFK